MSAARRRLGDTAAPASGLAAAYGRPLSMEEVFDKLLQLERQLGDERAERQRVEQALDEERAARQALERDMGARLRGMEIASKSGSGWKQELVGLREEMGGGADRAQKQLDDHKDSLNAILEVLEDTVTREQVEAALQGLRGEVAAGTGAAAGSATAEEVEELAAALEELDEKLSEQAQNLESVVDEIGETEEGLGARLGKCEEAAITASTLAASIPGEIEKGLQKFEAKTAQLDKLVEGHVEEELRGFAQSFRLAVTRIDQVVQQLDKKIEHSVGSVATRLSEENGMLDEQIGRVSQSVERALVEAQHKLENLAADIQQFVLQVGADKVNSEAIATSTASRVEEIGVGLSRARADSSELEHKLRNEMTEGDRALRVEMEAARLGAHSASLTVAAS